MDFSSSFGTAGTNGRQAGVSPPELKSKYLMSLFDDMTLMELAEIAYDVLCERVVLSPSQISEFQKVFSSRIEQCEHLETLKGRDATDPPQQAA
jgi:hypothetical protein